jgi:hypothetical protein
MKGMYAQTYKYRGAGVFASGYWVSDNSTASNRRATMRVATHPAVQNWVNVILDVFYWLMYAVGGVLGFVLAAFLVAVFIRLVHFISHYLPF